jgi:hypothetical protein
MKYVYLALSFLILGNSNAQLVVDMATFASNPSRYNGKHIVIRGVNISKPSSSSLSLSGPRTTSNTSPTGGPTTATGGVATGTAIPTTQTQPGSINIATGSTHTTLSGTATTSSRVTPCNPPTNWEILNVEIPNYNACYTIYNQMASTIPSGRTLNADITLFVNTRLLHRVVRVKLN